MNILPMASQNLAPSLHVGTNNFIIDFNDMFVECKITIKNNTYFYKSLKGRYTRMCYLCHPNAYIVTNLRLAEHILSC
jgi:hypothetical protein